MAWQLVEMLTGRRRSRRRTEERNRRLAVEQFERRRLGIEPLERRELLTTGICMISGTISASNLVASTGNVPVRGIQVRAWIGNEGGCGIILPLSHKWLLSEAA